MVSPVSTRNQIESIGRLLLEAQSNPIFSHRILQDVQCLPPGLAELTTFNAYMLTHPWVEEFGRFQCPDGSWSHFHSMESTIKTRFSSTEIAIRRALMLAWTRKPPSWYERSNSWKLSWKGMRRRWTGLKNPRVSRLGRKTSPLPHWPRLTRGILPDCR